MKAIIIAPLILIGAASVGFAAPSVVDIAVNPANNHTYELLSNSDWLSAESAAVSLGGHLVTINDQAENDWLYNQWGQTRSLMIGLTDAATEGTFVWTSGQAFTYSNWNLGEPNNGVGFGTTPENYVYMYANGFGTPGKWNDYQGGSDLFPQPATQGVVELPEPGLCSLITLGGLAARFRLGRTSPCRTKGKGVSVGSNR
jgi:hypothetical protein